MTEYLIATSVLEDIVRGSLESEARARIQTPLPLVRTRPIEITVDSGRCFVSVCLEARMGENLHSLAADLRQTIAAALSSMTGLSVVTVDVTFNGVFPVAV